MWFLHQICHTSDINELSCFSCKIDDMSLYSFLRTLRPEYQAIEIERLIVGNNSKTVLDLGCGSNSNLKFFKDKIEYSVGIDVCKSDLDISKNHHIHNKYILDDVMNVDKYYSVKSFDCVMAIGLVEHLEKKQSLKLMEKMEKIARKLIVIGTPNGFISQEEYDNNPYQVHKSGFTLGDFTSRKYKVLGMDGLKMLRGENAKIKYKPEVLFSIITNLIDPLLRPFPKISFNLLAYKHLNTYENVTDPP